MNMHPIFQHPPRTPHEQAKLDAQVTSIFEGLTIGGVAALVTLAVSWFIRYHT